jgi:hypothetical protein
MIKIKNGVRLLISTTVLSGPAVVVSRCALSPVLTRILVV